MWFIMEQNNKVFFCYSYNLKEYFVKNGLKYFNTNINHNTQRRYWIFLSCNELDILLEKWRSRRNYTC